MNHETALWIVLVLFLAGNLNLTIAMLRQETYLRRLERKLDALLKAQGVEWPFLSPEVQILAQNPRKKIASIKLHREENPGFSLAEAKSEIEAFAAKGIKHSHR